MIIVMMRNNYLESTVPLRQGDERREQGERSGGGMTLSECGEPTPDYHTPSVPLHFIALHSFPFLDPDPAFGLVPLEEGTVQDSAF